MDIVSIIMKRSFGCPSRYICIFLPFKRGIAQPGGSFHGVGQNGRSREQETLVVVVEKQNVAELRARENVTAQVAARASDGVRLITVALAQDELGNGGWGPLYGNLHQYSDPMLEENVNK